MFPECSNSGHGGQCRVLFSSPQRRAVCPAAAEAVLARCPHVGTRPLSPSPGFSWCPLWLPGPGSGAVCAELYDCPHSSLRGALFSGCRAPMPPWWFAQGRGPPGTAHLGPSRLQPGLSSAPVSEWLWAEPPPGWSERAHEVEAPGVHVGRRAGDWALCAAVTPRREGRRACPLGLPGCAGRRGLHSLLECSRLLRKAELSRSEWDTAFPEPSVSPTRG